MARQQRVVAAHPAQARAHAPQQAVARRVAEGVVDELEVVEVDEQERHRPPAAPRTRDRRAQARLELGTVRQTRHRVEERELAQLGLGAYALGDVLPREHGDALPGGVAQARDLPGDLAPQPRARQHLALVVVDRILLGEQPTQCLTRGGALLGRHDLGEPVGAHELAARVLEHLAALAVEERDHAVRGQDHEQRARNVEVGLGAVGLDAQHVLHSAVGGR